MRLLYVGNTASPHFCAWPEHFARRGHDVHVLHFAPVPPSSVEGATLHTLPRFVWAARGAWRLGALWLRRLRGQLRAEIVHTHQVVPVSYAAVLARMRPHVATAWGSEVLLENRPRQRRRIQRVARTADLVTADSSHVLDVLAELGAAPERRRLVPWGVDRAWMEPAVGLSRDDAARRIGLPADRTIVLSPRGTLELYEPETVLRGLAAAAGSVLGLLGVVAIDPGSLEHLWALVRELRISEHVTFRPKWLHEQMPFVYRAAAACVSVPRSDSAPTSVIEAVALGVPVAVSDLPWTREEPYRRLSMEVVPVGDPEALGRAIERLVEEGAAGDNGQVVSECFDRDALFGAFEAEYERLAG